MFYRVPSIIVFYKLVCTLIYWGIGSAPEMLPIRLKTQDLLQIINFTTFLPENLLISIKRRRKRGVPENLPALGR